MPTHAISAHKTAKQTTIIVLQNPKKASHNILFCTLRGVKDLHLVEVVILQSILHL